MPRRFANRLISRTIVAATIAGGPSAFAGAVNGKLELPPSPKRQASPRHGFVAATENLLAPIRQQDPTPSMFVMLDGPAPAGTGNHQIMLDIVGEKFASSVVALPVGAELVIKNNSKVVRYLSCAEVPGLVEKRPLNPTTTLVVKPQKAGDVYVIRDSESPHLTVTVAVTASTAVAQVSSDGKFEINNVPEGKYALRVFFRNGWLDGAGEALTVTATGKVEAKVKVPAGWATIPFATNK